METQAKSDHPLSAGEAGWKERARAELARARARTRALIGQLSDQTLVLQPSELMSPLVWDLAHLANYEEQWLLLALGAPRVSDPASDGLYDPLRHPRATRGRLPLLGPAEASTYLDRVRTRALEHLDALDPEDSRPLLRDGFVYGLVVQHEHQHLETMLATLQLMPSPELRAAARAPAPPPSPKGEVLIPAGPVELGAADEPWAYDNERPAHPVELPSFFIDARPVTNAELLEFLEEDGYDRPELWSTEGWAHRQAAALRHPLHWLREGARWGRWRFGAFEPLPFFEPVQHVCFYEAEAYARWAGKRLPTEAEWERAAATVPTWVLGDAAASNLGGRRLGPGPVGSFARGASAEGCEQLFGEVWEWTATDFAPYPGFVAFPYRGYSEVFFGGGYKVLRGGSWATDRAALRRSFRNWDFPIRRQIFSGFRCARDAAPSRR